MIRVFTTVDWYLPGDKSGGPVRTLAATAERLRGEVELCLFTRDRDFGDAAPYPGVRRDQWVEVRGARVWYASPRRQGTADLARAAAAAAPAALYANSLFSPLTRRLLLALRLGRIRRLPLLLAPRGELSPGALGLKAWKKLPYLRLLGASGLLRGVLWQASTRIEEEEIRGALRRHRIGPGEVAVARDLVAGDATTPPPRPPKAPGAARLAFVSRITPKKNLHRALELVLGLRGRVELEIAGPVDDPAYLERCRELAARAPAGIAVAWRGPVPHAEVRALFAGADAFVFPTLGENFGHVIHEALSAGCPVLVSDRTPWRGLEAAGAGLDLPLEDEGAWRRALQGVVDMDEPERTRLAAGALALAARAAEDPVALEQNLALFRRLAASPT